MRPTGVSRAMNSVYVFPGEGVDQPDGFGQSALLFLDPMETWRITSRDPIESEPAPQLRNL